MAPTPSTKPLAARLHLKPNMRGLLLFAPDEIDPKLGGLPDGVTLHTEIVPSTTYDWALVFLASKAVLDAHGPAVFAHIARDGVLWFAYPKLASKRALDISRDRGWDVVDAHDWLGVTQIAVNDIWSALRFRPRAAIKTLTRKSDHP
jgi:hypothetical protein